MAQEAGDWLMSDANQLDRRPERASVPEPSWWNMAVPIVIIVGGVALGYTNKAARQMATVYPIIMASLHVHPIMFAIAQTGNSRANSRAASGTVCFFRPRWT